MDKEYKLVDRKDKGTVMNPHLRKSKETIEMEKLPSVPSNSNIVSYDKKKDVYTLIYSSCATAEDYKITQWKLDEKNGSGKLGYVLYDLAMRRVVLKMNIKMQICNTV